MTVDFLKEEFGFSGRETVAIMGAHTFGRFHVEDSLYPYVWTSYGEALWNNDYYKYVVFVDMYFVLEGGFVRFSLTDSMDQSISNIYIIKALHQNKNTAFDSRVDNNS